MINRQPSRGDKEKRVYPLTSTSLSIREGFFIGDDMKKLCVVDGCTGVQRAKGLCNRHYIQLKRHGKLNKDVVVKCLESERWEDIKGTSGMYKISSKGRVKSCLFNREKLLSPSWDRKREVFTVTCGAGNLHRVHALVAHHFVDNVFNEKTVVFVDGNKQNICSDNLAWFGLSRRESTIESLTLAADNCQYARACLEYMEGRKDALNSILQEIWPKLLSRTRYLHTFYADIHGVRRNCDLEGIVQESIIKILSAIERGLMADTKRFLGWIYRIARNTLINANRIELNTVSQNAKNRNGDNYDYVDHAINNGMVIG